MNDRLAFHPDLTDAPWKTGFCLAIESRSDSLQPFLSVTPSSNQLLSRVRARAASASGRRRPDVARGLRSVSHHAWDLDSGGSSVGGRRSRARGWAGRCRCPASANLQVAARRGRSSVPATSLGGRRRGGSTQSAGGRSETPADCRTSTATVRASAPVTAVATGRGEQVTRMSTSGTGATDQPGVGPGPFRWRRCANRWTRRTVGETDGRPGRVTCGPVAPNCDARQVASVVRRHPSCSGSTDKSARGAKPAQRRAIPSDPPPRTSAGA